MAGCGSIGSGAGMGPGAFSGGCFMPSGPGACGMFPNGAGGGAMMNEGACGGMCMPGCGGMATCGGMNGCGSMTPFGGIGGCSSMANCGCGAMMPGMMAAMPSLPGMQPGMMMGGMPDMSSLPPGMADAIRDFKEGKQQEALQKMPKIPGMVLVPNPMMMQMANPMLISMMQSQMSAAMSANAMPMPGVPVGPSNSAGSGSAATSGSGGSATFLATPAKANDKIDGIDPAVQELGDYFNIEERWIRRLNETMKKRKDTQEADLAKLYEVLEHARSPTGLLTVKIGEMECGQFVGKIKPDKDVEALAKKHRLDEHVKSRLTELCIRRKATKEQDLECFSQHLKYSKRPSAMAMILVGKLLENEIPELPDLGEAEEMMRKYKMDEDAKSKLAEIVRSRANDAKEVLGQLRRHLDGSPNPSAVVCRVASNLIDGGTLKDPPPKQASGQADRSGRDRDERGSRDDRASGRGREHRDRDRERDRRRSRSRS